MKGIEATCALYPLNILNTRSVQIRGVNCKSFYLFKIKWIASDIFKFIIVPQERNTSRRLHSVLQVQRAFISTSSQISISNQSLWWIYRSIEALLHHFTCFFSYLIFEPLAVVDNLISPKNIGKKSIELIAIPFPVIHTL